MKITSYRIIDEYLMDEYKKRLERMQRLTEHIRDGNDRALAMNDILKCTQLMIECSLIIELGEGLAKLIGELPEQNN